MSATVRRAPAPTSARAAPRVRYSVNTFLDGFFFVFAGLAAIWLASIVVGEGFQVGWSALWYLVAFWVLLAYLVLPRLHRILTTIYVPDYFIGRARTSDGLLGDPVNLALRGDEAALRAAMEAADWTQADGIALGSTWRIITSTLTRRSYDEAPVSPLFLFGRQQDFAYQQEVAGNPAKRHHVRFWRCPDDWMLPGGTRVDWLAAGTFDRAVGFSLFTLQITHKIDADTDVERDHIIATITTSTPDVAVDVIRDFSTGYHSRNGGGDSITTDGDMPIVDLRAQRTDESASVAAIAPTTAAPEIAPTTAAPEIAHPSAPAIVDPAAAPAIVDPATARTDGLKGAKRPAFESALDLAERQSTGVVRSRPLPTSIGSVLVILRVLAGSWWIVTVFQNWSAVVAGSSVDLDGVPADGELSGNIGAWIIVIVGTLVLLFELGVGTWAFLGRNWARVAILLTATFSVLFSAFDVLSGGQQITLRTTLLTLSIDILILLAFSSRASRAWARRPRRTRRDRHWDARRDRPPARGHPDVSSVPAQGG